MISAAWISFPRLSFFCLLFFIIILGQFPINVGLSHVCSAEQEEGAGYLGELEEALMHHHHHHHQAGGSSKNTAIHHLHQQTVAAAAAAHHHGHGVHNNTTTMAAMAIPLRTYTQQTTLSISLSVLASLCRL